MVMSSAEATRTDDDGVAQAAAAIDDGRAAGFLDKLKAHFPG